MNSIKVLNKNGMIILHDCLPPSINHQRVPRTRYSWNGDVWKSIVHCRTLENIDTYTFIADRGIGLIFPRKNKNLVKFEKKVNF